MFSYFRRTLCLHSSRLGLFRTDLTDLIKGSPEFYHVPSLPIERDRRINNRKYEYLWKTINLYEMSEYDNVCRGSLKLKGVADHKIKKKKKKKSKDKDLSKVLESINSHAGSSGDEAPRQIEVDKRTKAEIAFEKIREERAAKQILEKAAKSHKERIMEFNEHLDGLTEHFDIPKVSWTK